MTAPPKPRNEQERLRVLDSYDILDSESEENFDRITRIASAIFGTPIALVSLVDENRQWFKSKVGLDVGETPRDLAFCAHAICGDDVMVVSDASHDARFRGNSLVTAEPRIRFYAGAPLTSPSGHNLGTLCIIDREPRQLEQHQVTALADLAGLVVRELELRKAASTDFLTGATNRRKFMTTAMHEFARARRYKRPMSVAMFDLDHFKRVNDTYGHAAGDEALKSFAALCQQQIRQQDCFGRMGGEEFALILVETPARDALAVVARIVDKVAAIPIKTEDREFAITVSAGLAALRDTDENLGDLMIRADRGLYGAKVAGRNRAILDEAPTPSPESAAEHP